MAGAAGREPDRRARLTLFAAAIGTLVAALTMVSPATAFSPLKVRSATDSAAPDEPLSATASCRPNERVVSGGFQSGQAGAPLISRKLGARKWTATTFNDDGNLTVFAYCRRGIGVSTRSATDTASGTGAQAEASATCRSQTTLASGGFQTLDSLGASEMNAFVSRRSGGSGWRIAVVNNAPQTSTLSAFAYCQLDGKVKERVSQAPIGSNANGSATAGCHADEELISGGYTTNPATDWFNASGPDLFYGESYRSARRSWTVSAHNYSNVGGTLTAIAYCGGKSTVHPKAEK